MSCRIINLTNKEVESKLWSQLKDQTNSEEKADELYEQCLSEDFLKTFDWLPKPTLFLRHSLTDNDLAKRELVDSKDLSISKVGIEESRRTATELRKKGVTMIYSSPIRRALETLAVIKEENSEIQSEVINNLATWNLGIFEGKPIKHFDEKWWVNHPDSIPSQGESFNQFKDRVTKAINELRPKINSRTAILVHSKVLDLIEGLQESAGKWDKNAQEAYFKKGIDDKSKQQVWSLKTFDTEVAKRTTETGEPTIGAVNEYLTQKSYIDYLRSKQDVEQIRKTVLEKILQTEQRNKVFEIVKNQNKLVAKSNNSNQAYEMAKQKTIDINNKYGKGTATQDQNIITIKTPQYLIDEEVNRRTELDKEKDLKDAQEHDNNFPNIYYKKSENVNDLYNLSKKLNFTEYNIKNNETISKELAQYDSPELQLENVGITKNQRKAYIPKVSELLSKNLSPFSYDKAIHSFLNSVFNIVKYPNIPTRQDAWNLYLGLPQINNTFELAKTKPSLKEVYTDLDFSKIDIYSFKDSYRLIPQNAKDLETFLNKKVSILQDKSLGVMGGYNIRLTEKGIEYNDLWDLEPKMKILGKYITIPIEKIIGKPFLIHGIIPNTDIETLTSLLDYYKFENIIDKNDVIKDLKKFHNLSTDDKKQVNINSELEKKVERFLSEIGVNVQHLKDEGQSFSGLADTINGVIQIVDGKADIKTLSHEATHMFLDLLPKDSELLKEIIDDVKSHEKYKEVYEQYKDNVEYQNEDGSVNEEKIAKEVAAHIIDDIIVDKHQKESTMKWWEKLWNWIKNLFKNKTQINSFDQIANDILNNNVSKLSKEKLESLKDKSNKNSEKYYQLDTHKESFVNFENKVFSKGEWREKIDNTYKEKFPDKNDELHKKEFKEKARETYTYMKNANFSDELILKKINECL
jgi:broad specificity phosphatase PhoE